MTLICPHYILQLDFLCNLPRLSWFTFVVDVTVHTYSTKVDQLVGLVDQPKWRRALRRNISLSAWFYVAISRVFCHACMEIKQYFSQNLIRNFLNFLKTFKKYLQNFFYFSKKMLSKFLQNFIEILV